MKEKKEKLVLGTVQLGMKYGVANVSGQPSMEDSFHILDTALKSGINIFDTAWAYGTSEDVLGSWIKARSLKGKVNIISKLNPHLWADFSDEKKAYQIIQNELKNTLDRLGVDSLDGYLCYFSFYNATNIQNVIEGMRALKKEGKIKNIGVTVYDAEEALQSIELGIDYIQAPYNVFDQRLDNSIFFDSAEKNNVKVFARSPFMQGLLLMDPQNLPVHLDLARPFLENFIALSEKYDMTQSEAALHFSVNSRADHIVFGVDSVEQLSDIIQITGAIPDSKKDFIIEVKEIFKKMDDRIVDPRLWNAPPAIMHTPQAIIILSGGSLKASDGTFHSTTYDDGDAFGVLGGYARVEAAGVLARKFPHTTLITAGKGAGDGITPSHAMVMKRELVDFDVKPERIILEENSISTMSGIEQAFSLAKKYGWSSILFVTNEYHVQRLRLMVEKVGAPVHAECIPAEEIIIQARPLFQEEFEEIKSSLSYRKRLESELKGIEALRSGKYKEARIEDKKERLV